jgi:hypothetical protein
MKREFEVEWTASETEIDGKRINLACGVAMIGS